MLKNRKLPVGMDNFESIRRGDFYYVDKTALVEQLLDSRGMVNLFTRPRRFGKTLNMSMLKCFLEIGADPTLFEGLYISGRRDLCEAHMGKYPVIFLTLKGVEGLTFASALSYFIELVGREAERFRFLWDSERLTEEERGRYRTLIALQNGQHVMSDTTLRFSLKTLSELLWKHCGRKAVILIDEYDVPLDKAFQNGCYREMVELIRAMFGEALKTNEYLEFAVLTGCLRVAKESIFTGLNNLKVMSIIDAENDEQFGFTDQDVQKILADYDAADKFEETKAWYDGYHFGDADIYCPWDVINFADALRRNPTAKPEPYWINTSGNGLVKRFIDKADRTTRTEIEQLLAGEAIEKQIRLDLTYDEIDTSIDNLWSVLFTTGYLTEQGEAEGGVYRLVIPNREVCEVFKLKIQEWFKEITVGNTARITAFWRALEVGDIDAVEKYINRTLSNSISVFDTKGQQVEKENVYHTLLVGLLSGNGDWLVKSNVEAGDGFADIIIETDDPDAGIVVELKYVKDMGELDSACDRALRQIREKHYADYLLNELREDVRCYGIAFCRKRCRVKTEAL